MTTATARLWTKKLDTLGETLRAEADADPARWAWYQMPRGALVSCYAGNRPDPVYGKRGTVFRIARKPAPANAIARRQWKLEVEIFLGHLKLTDWQVEHADEGGVAAVFVLPPNPTLL